MLRILLICTGNTCRSPMAEVLLNKKIRETGLTEQIKVLSAGLYTAGGSPASSGAKAAVMKRGLDLTIHRSRQLQPEDIQAADLVLVMTGAHKRALLELAPQSGAKVHTLAEYAGEQVDVPDPFGGTGEIYEACAAEIDRLLNKVWQKLTNLAGKNDSM